MISVIIVTYNRAQLLEKCLQSIFNQDYDDPCEIILVDNGSTDGTSDLIEKKFQNQIHYLRFSQRRSIALCKKDALKITQGECVAFLDDDCEADPQWLRELQKALTHYDVVGGPVLPYPDARFPWWWQKTLNWMIGINTMPNMRYLPLGSNSAFKKEVLVTLKEKALSNTMLSPYHEDYARIREVVTQGTRLCINSHLRVYHYVPRERVHFLYLIRRSWEEGRAWGEWERSWTIVLASIGAIPILLLRGIIFLNLNHFFRIIVRIRYVFHWCGVFKKK